MRAIKYSVLVTVLALTPAIAAAQNEADSSLFWDVTRSVVFDPTTYAPATLSYTSMKLDWASSQLLFHNGWVEENRRFTQSGKPNDLPLSFADGNAKIRQMALLQLQESLINNVAVNVFERVLAEKYPRHRTLFKTLSWVERIAFASYVSYVASASHFRQTQRNRELARQYGYR